MSWQEIFSAGSLLGGFGDPLQLGGASSPFGEDPNAFNSVLEGQTQAAAVAQPQQKAGGSIMFKILSGAMLGLAGGAGAPDPGTAFAQGYQKIEQEREKERQMILEEKKLRQQEQIFDAQMMDYHMRKMEHEQKMREAPERLKMEKEQLFYQKMETFDKMGRDYLTSTSEDGVAGYLESLKAGGENLARITWEPGPDGQVHFWRQNNERDVYPEGSVLPGLGNVAGKTVKEVDQMEMALFNNKLETERINLQGQWGVREASIRAAAMNNGSEAQPKETPEQRQTRELINNYADQIKMLRGENAKGVPGENSKAREARLAANQQQIDMLNQEIGKLMGQTPTQPYSTQDNITFQYKGQTLVKGQTQHPTQKGAVFTGQFENGVPVWEQRPVQKKTLDPNVKIGNYNLQKNMGSMPNWGQAVDKISQPFNQSSINPAKQAQVEQAVNQMKGKLPPQEILQRILQQFNTDGAQYAEFLLNAEYK